MANNTIAGNTAYWYGGGLYLDESSATIANTLVVFNSSGVYVTGAGSRRLRYNCVFGNAEYDYSGVTDLRVRTAISGRPAPGRPGVRYGHLQPGSHAWVQAITRLPRASSTSTGSPGFSPWAAWWTSAQTNRMVPLGGRVRMLSYA